MVRPGPASHGPGGGRCPELGRYPTTPDRLDPDNTHLPLSPSPLKGGGGTKNVHTLKLGRNDH